MAREPLGGLGRASMFEASRSHFSRHTTLGRTPLDEGPARRRDLYLTTHNTHKRQRSMPSAVFEPTILVSERPKTHALDRTATGIGIKLILELITYDCILIFTSSHYKIYENCSCGTDGLRSICQ
jgi:hypothetical protein